MLTCDQRNKHSVTDPVTETPFSFRNSFNLHSRSRCWISTSSSRPSPWFIWWISPRRITSRKRTNGESWRLRWTCFYVSSVKSAGTETRRSRRDPVGFQVHSFSIWLWIDSRAGSESDMPWRFFFSIIQFLFVQHFLTIKYSVTKQLYRIYTKV